MVKSWGPRFGRLLIVVSVCLLALALVSVSFARTKTAASKHAGLTPGETGTVRYVIDGDTFVMQDGLRVNLSGITAPRKRFSDQSEALPLANEAQTALNKLITGRTVRLYYGKDRRDRYNRAQAQVWILNDKGEPVQWLQNAMVEQGYARAYPWPGDQYDIDALYRSEARAMAERRGIWDTQVTQSFYAVRTPEPNALIQYGDSTQIVEGIIISTADVRGTQYLNFGSDYKTDFTIAVAKKHRRVFEKAGVDLQSLEGARVRVRGYIEIGNGPVIWLQTPARLQILN